MDLRQYGAITARDLELLPRSLRQLSLGPYFAPSLTTRAIVEAVPVSHLTHLHLDLSKVLHEDDAVERDVAVVRLLQRCRAAGPAAPLQHLALRLRPSAQDGHGDEHEGMPGDDLARILARHLPNCCRNVRSLNLDGNMIGDAGVQALVQALSSAFSDNTQTFNLQHLSLSNNLITSLSCQVLASLLATNDVCQLKSLDLSHNAGIGLDGMFVIVQALQGNTSLRNISWVGCGQMLQCHETMIYERLLDLLERYNTTLVSIGVPSSYRREFASGHQLLQRQKEKLCCWLLLNRSGRYLLRQQPRGDDVAPLPTGLWPHVFARASQVEQQQQQEASADDGGRATTTTATTKVAPNCMFYLLRNTVGQAWAIAPGEKRS